MIAASLSAAGADEAASARGLLLDLVDDAQDQGLEDLLLAGEVVVERPLGDAHDPQDVLHGRGLKALGGEQGVGGVENLLATLRGRAVDARHGSSLVRRKQTNRPMVETRVRTSVMRTLCLAS